MSKFDEYRTILEGICAQYNTNLEVIAENSVYGYKRDYIQYEFSVSHKDLTLDIRIQSDPDETTVTFACQSEIEGWMKVLKSNLFAQLFQPGRIIRYDRKRYVTYGSTELRKRFINKPVFRAFTPISRELTIEIKSDETDVQILDDQSQTISIAVGNVIQNEKKFKNLMALVETINSCLTIPG